MSKCVEVLTDSVPFAAADDVKLQRSIEGVRPGAVLLPDAVASLLGTTVGTLRAWRGQSRGPAYVKLSDGFQVAYRPADILSWLDSSPWTKPSIQKSAREVA